MKTRILLVDDDYSSLELMSDIFKQNEYDTFTAENGLEALRIIRDKEPDIVVSDLFMPEMDGLELLDVVSKKYPEIPIIMITAHGTIETAVEAMRKGARDYILKPLRLEEIVAKVETIAQLKSLQKENQMLRSNLTDKYNFDKIIGSNPKMLELFDLLKMVAPNNSTVLIQGEHGTGKELIANAIHYNSKRVNKPLVKVNCTVLTENLLESELFGHVKGAYTGALKDKMGRFELADGGTIFLDEIGDISPNMQLKLLRVLQEREFERVGDNKTIKVDVRIIAATNKNLDEAMKEGSFRQDLFFRLNVIPITVPPLRERTDDIPLLVSHFVQKYSKEFEKEIKGVDEEVLKRMQTYHWPGNIRELENLIQRAIVLSQSDVLTVKDFPPKVMNADSLPSVTVTTDRPLQELVDEFERQIILKGLAENNHNKLRTAEKLGIHRSTFMSKLKKYGIK